MNVNTSQHGGRWFAEVECGRFDRDELHITSRAAVDAITIERDDLDPFMVVLDRTERVERDGESVRVDHFRALRTAAEVAAVPIVTLEEFMRGHVSRYVLPTKLDAAQAKGAKSVSVPTADMTRLLARVGEHLAPATAEDVPSMPDKLAQIPTELVDLMEWDADGQAIVSREQIHALIAQAAREAYALPRATARRKAAASVTETVAAAIATGKRAVSVPVGDLARMLDTVQAQRQTTVQAVAA